ncbi:Calmodulin-regulated spectrin-associated protein 3 [Saguinus oedipus]|uniref:Calmodulin-regulated spectrin-associated protein 3 n=1 Tax=Saguinus oedipus TaxID=9490 RepID=A0ABQ9WCD3_SAGOE|nr:Calmodulin-regulated spectrin-associated protein 3 [Saguinus oedipus]
MVESIYKYNSDCKFFTQIPTKTMSMSVDAFTIQGHLWQGKKSTTPKGGSTPKQPHPGLGPVCCGCHLPEDS